jgi:hypothetical protein
MGKGLAMFAMAYARSFAFAAADLLFEQAAAANWRALWAARTGLGRSPGQGCEGTGPGGLRPGGHGGWVSQ